MQNCFKLLILLLVPIYVTAQNIPVKVTKSEVFKDKYFDSDNINLIEGDGKDGILIVRSYIQTKKTYSLEHYDSNLKLNNEYEYIENVSETEKFNRVMGMITNNDEIHFINFKYSRTEKAYICSANTAKIGDFKFSTKELFRIESEENTKNSYYSFGGVRFGNNRKSLVKMIINEDKNAFVISVNINEDEVKAQKIFLFDNTLNKKVEHVYKRDYKNLDYKIKEFEVSNDGNVIFLLGEVHYEKNKNTKEDEKTEFELCRITNNDEKNIVLESNNLKFLSLKVFTNLDKLSCVGFYSESNKDEFDGIAYFEIDPISLQIIKTKRNPFSEQFLIDKFGNKIDKKIKGISFKNLFFTKKNEIVINAEEGFTIYTKNYTTHFFNDIITLKLDENGEMMWAKDIKKEQKSTMYISYFSYTSLLKDDETYFFVNAEKKIKSIGNNRIEFDMNSINNINLNVIKIDEKGEISFKEILNEKDIEVPIITKGKNLNGSVYFMGVKGKKKQLIKVTL